MKKRITRRKPFSRFYGAATTAVLLILAVVVVFAIALVSSNKFTQLPQQQYFAISYACCDSGDGAACQPQNTKVLQYQGVKASAPAEYWLLKSNAYLRSQDHHIDPDPRGAKTPDGDRIFYNPRSELNKKDWSPECFSNVSSPGKQRFGYDDFIFGPGSGPNTNPSNPDYPELGCFAIPNEQLIYVCRGDNAPGECDNKAGHARFDIYYRIGDLTTYQVSATEPRGIHDVIKNCVKPELAPTGGSGQQIVGLPSPSGKPNLQLETFTIIDEPPVVDWISPYCKPAIYLYPEKKTEVHVQVKPKGPLTYTIPAYPENGWKVVAHPDGRIDYGKDVYEYLYWESEIPDELIQKPAEGYVSTYTELPLLLPDVLTKLGLNEKEQKAFIEYWLGVLPRSNYYLVKVIPEPALDVIAPLMISPKPTSTLRVTLYFEALDKDMVIKEPTLTRKKRTGFTVVEWGGIFKRDNSHAFSCFM